MSIINKWKIHCSTDSKWEYWYLPDGFSAPTTCPANTSHAVTSGSVSVAEVIDNSVTKIHSLTTQGDKTSRLLGKLFTATKATTTDIDMLIDFKYLKGGKLESKDNVFPLDTFSVVIIDIDNVLGFGPNVVLDDYIKDLCVPENGVFEIKSDDISGALPAGVYVRVSYKSHAGATVDVTGGVSMYGFNDV